MASPVTPADDGTLQQDAALSGRGGNDVNSGTISLPVATEHARSEDSLAVTPRGFFTSHYGQARRRLETNAVRFSEWLSSVQGRGVLKCTFAYALASLATFVGPLSDFLGKPDGKHVVATITVYFHAARSAGSMIEAILIAVVAVIYAEVVSMLSMATSVFVGSQMGLVTLAHVLVVVIFIGGGFGFMGWVKQRMNNPLVNVGSTLASLAIIGVVTKENAVVDNVFSNQKISQVLKMLVMGIFCAAFVNLMIWRVDARQQLRASMRKASTSLGDILSDVTTSFLRGVSNHDVSPEHSASASAYAQAHTLLLRNLREAKFEQYFLGRERVYALERSTVRAIETLAHSVGGLKSAGKTQLKLLQDFARHASSHAEERTDTLSGLPYPSPSGTEYNLTTQITRSSESPPAEGYRAALQLHAAFTDKIMSPMEELTSVLSQVLHEPPFGEPPSYEMRINESFGHRLSEKLRLYTDRRVEALQSIYDLIEKERKTNHQSRALSEEVAAACGHFTFSLQTFAEEMKKYLDILEDLSYANEHPRRSWRWILWWKGENWRKPGVSALPFDSPETEALVKPIRHSSIPTGIPEALRRQRDTYNWQAAPNKSAILATVSQNVLRLMRKMARDDILFGIKVGIGASLWAMFAFLDETRETYNHYRGEWGLLSFMIVCSMTVGASNTTGWARFVGTFMGAVFSVVNWNLSQGNAIALIVLGWLVSFFNFYLIVALGKAPLGRMTILAYNVSTLYAYSLSQKVTDDDDDEGGIHPLIMEIVKHRAISVTAGILWGLIVCRLVWPISARRKFKEGISVLFLQMGLIWRRGPLAILLRSDCSESYLKSGEQLALQKYASRLEGLRHSAASEFELKGPFPFHVNGRILDSSNRILDSFYAMSLVTQPKGSLTAGEKALLNFTAPERAILCDRICHIFQVLASSMMLEYPLTDAIPSIVATRDRLLSKIFRFREMNGPCVDNAHETNGTAAPQGSATAEGSGMGDDAAIREEDYALLYAYVLVTGQVANELRVAAAEIEGLLGVLGDGPLLLE